MKRYTNIFIVVTFQVFTTVSMKMTVFWDVAPCSLVKVERRFRGAYCSIIRAFLRKLSPSPSFPEDIGKMFLRNAGNHLQDYTASQIRRLQSTFSTPRAVRTSSLTFINVISQSPCRKIATDTVSIPCHDYDPRNQGRNSLYVCIFVTVSSGSVYLSSVHNTHHQ
jgi:hypothetical protein